MISELKIGNFKAFGPAQTIPLRPITLVFGPNSAGKSSIIQSLLLARHIQDTGNLDVHQTTLGGKAVDLGGFGRYVHQHESERCVELKVTVKRSDVVTKITAIDEFDTLTMGYRIGMRPLDGVVSAKQEIVVTSVDIFLDGREVRRLSRGDDGNFRMERTAISGTNPLATKSAFDATTGRRFAEAMASTLESKDLIPLADKHGVPESEVIDPTTGKASVDGCLKILNRMPNQRGESACLIEILWAATFGARGLALDCLNPLPRTGFYTTDDMSPEEQEASRDPVQFFAELLKIREEDDEDDTWPGYFEAINRWHQDHNYVEPTGSAYEKARDFALRYEIECLIEAASRAVVSGLAGLTYLGPLRWIPPRHLLEPDELDATWIAGGGDAWQRLRRDEAVLNEVNRFLKDVLHTRYQLKCDPLSPTPDAAAIERCIKQAREKIAGAPLETHSDESSTARVAEEEPATLRKVATDAELATAVHAELTSHTARETLIDLRIVDSDSGLAVSHRDVGTGISQLLPVIVNAVAAQGKLIAIEQPELHLHPALQAELGDVFIESALGPNGNRFLIETHSEHLILRLLKRIRQTTGGQTGNLPAIQPDDIALLYVESRGEGSVVHHLRVDEHGRLIDPCPGGFFEEDFDELF